MVVALVLSPSTLATVRIGANVEYEEPAYRQKIPGYHPMLRFLTQGSMFVFSAPKGIVEGHYARSGGHYDFHPETYELLNRTDVDKLVADMPPKQRADTIQAYNESIQPFQGDYNPSSGELSLERKDPGMPGYYTLEDYTAGDASLPSLVSDDAKPLVGLWGQTDPNPEKLDSKTRYRIDGIDGLRRFSDEAAGSDGAEFNLIDLRSDGTFRIHQEEGRWQRNGATVHLQSPKIDLTLQISRDLTKLFTGKTVYMR